MVKILIFLSIIFLINIIFKAAGPAMDRLDARNELREIRQHGHELARRLDIYKANFNSYSTSLVTPEVSPCDGRMTLPATYHFKINCRIVGDSEYEIQIIGTNSKTGYKEILTFR